MAKKAASKKGRGTRKKAPAKPPAKPPAAPETEVAVQVIDPDQPVRGQLKQLEISIRERWPFQDNVRDATVGAMVKILEDPESSKRERTASARVLGALDKINMESRRQGLDIALQERRLEAEQTTAETPQEHHHTLRYVEDSDWYGNADRIDRAQIPESPETHPPESGQIQAPYLRETNGQNGNGSAGRP